MTTTRWIYPPGSTEGIPAEDYYAEQAAQRHAEAAFFMKDITPFVSPLDNTEITSRSALRDHERKHNVRQVGELKSPADFDNNRRRGDTLNEKAVERAFRVALDKAGL